jgi:hypothetical protein
LQLPLKRFDIFSSVESEDSVHNKERNFLIDARNKFHTFRGIPRDFTTIKDGVGIDNVVGDDVAFGGMGGDGVDEESHGGVPFD